MGFLNDNFTPGLVCGIKITRGLEANKNGNWNFMCSLHIDNKEVPTGDEKYKTWGFYPSEIQLNMFKGIGVNKGDQFIIECSDAEKPWPTFFAFIDGVKCEIIGEDGDWYIKDAPEKRDLPKDQTSDLPSDSAPPKETEPNLKAMYAMYAAIELCKLTERELDIKLDPEDRRMLFIEYSQTWCYSGQKTEKYTAEELRLTNEYYAAMNRETTPGEKEDTRSMDNSEPEEEKKKEDPDDDLPF